MKAQTYEWFNEDAKLVQQDSERQIAQQKAFLAAQEALTEFDEYLAGLTIDEAQAALDGLKEYEAAICAERDIETGWHRTVSLEQA